MESEPGSSANIRCVMLESRAADLSGIYLTACAKQIPDSCYAASGMTPKYL